MDHSKLTMAQKGLLFALYALIVLMVWFSFDALKDKGQEGFDSCVQAKCDDKGEAFCTKFREVNNCCVGAGGRTAQSDQGYICVF